MSRSPCRRPGCAWHGCSETPAPFALRVRVCARPCSPTPGPNRAGPHQPGRPCLSRGRYRQGLRRIAAFRAAVRVPWCKLRLSQVTPERSRCHFCPPDPGRLRTDTPLTGPRTTVLCPPGAGRRSDHVAPLRNRMGRLRPLPMESKVLGVPPSGGSGTAWTKAAARKRRITK